MLPTARPLFPVPVAAAQRGRLAGNGWRRQVVRGLGGLGLALLAACETIGTAEGPVWSTAIMNAPEPGKADKLARGVDGTYYIYPDSITQHSAARPADWNVLIFFQSDQPARHAQTGAMWHSAYGEYTIHCGNPSRRTASRRTVIATTGRNGQGYKVFQTGPGDPEPLSRPEDEALFNAVCNREEVRRSVAQARQADQLAQERQRAEQARAAESWRVAQAERERRERALAEERAQRQRVEMAEKVRTIDERLRKVEADSLRQDGDACWRTRDIVEAAKGTDRLAAATAAQQRICERHEKVREQERARERADELRRNQNCRGTPRVQRAAVEDLARRAGMNPASLTFNRLEVSSSGRSCFVTVYHPQGVATCEVKLGNDGWVAEIHFHSCR